MIVIVVLIVMDLMKRKESYTSSSVANIGTLGDYRVHPPESINNFVGYDNMQQYGTYYNPFFPFVSGLNEHYNSIKEPLSTRTPPREHYEDLPSTAPAIQTFQPVADVQRTSNEIKTLERLDRIDKDLLPKISKNVTPYNIDVADPVTYTYQVHAPRVIRKDRLALEADPVRGDIPINIYPDVPIIQRSQFNRDSLRLDGTFSEALAKTYDRLTGKTYFNQPIHLSHGSMLM